MNIEEIKMWESLELVLKGDCDWASSTQFIRNCLTETEREEIYTDFISDLAVCKMMKEPLTAELHRKERICRYIEELKKNAKPPQTSAGCSDQQQAEVGVPAELRTDEVEEMLSTIENVEVYVKEKGMKKAIDRSVFPWGYASRSSLRYIAGAVHDICKTKLQWKPFEIVTGKSNFMKGVKGRCDEVYNALIEAGYKVKHEY